MSHLFNSALFGAKFFNGGGTLAETFSTDSVAFEGVSLNDGSSIVLTRPPLKGPAREILGGNIPRDDGKYQTGEYFRETGIRLTGYLKAASKEAMADLMDSLSQTLAVPQGNLDVIEDNGTVKRFVATCVNWEEQFADRDRYHLTLVPFTFEFVSYQMPTAREYASEYTELTTSGNQSVVNSGTYKAKPVFILIFTAASAVTAVEIENTTTGESVTYTGSVAAGDILRFDGEEIEVRKNGVIADYSGVFPRLKPGTNVISVTVTGSGFTAGLTTKHKSRFVR
jgi:hypothetical protein